MNVVDALTLVVQGKVIVATVLTIIGNIKNFQAVYFHQRLKEPMTGLWSISWMSGIRNLARSDCPSKKLLAICT